MVKRQAGGSWDTAKPTGEDEGPTCQAQTGHLQLDREPAWKSLRAAGTARTAGYKKQRWQRPAGGSWGPGRGQRRWAAGGPAVGGAQTGRRNYKGLRRSTKKVPTHCRLCHRALCVLDTGSDTSTERAVTCPFPSVSVVEPNTL